MSDEASGWAQELPASGVAGDGRRAWRTSRAVRLGIGAVIVVAAAVAGGSVAPAVGDDDSDDVHRADHANDETPEQVPTGGTTWPEAPGMVDPHDHEPLAPYDERYSGGSPEEQAAADDLLADVRATLVGYGDVDAAVAAGYQAPDNPRGPRAHYVDPSVARGQVLDPSRPYGLVYYTGGDSGPVLLGAFFVAPPGTPAPTPAGDLVVWHSHSPSCPAFFATEEEPCTDARRMLHVWTTERLEMVARRTGRPVEVQVTDAFGTPFGASVAPVT